MLRHISRTLFLAALVVVVPLLPKPELLLTWPVVTALLVGMFLNLSQPPISAGEMAKKDESDRRSALFIYIGGISAFLVPILDFGYGRKIFPDPFATVSILGLVLTFGGLGFRYWSIRTLGKWFTSVVRVQEGQIVIQHGPYKHLRHPSYLGSFVMALGISVIFRSYFGLVACFVIFFPAYIYRMTVEEKTLVANLGAPYEEYRNRTFRLLPFIY